MLSSAFAGGETFPVVAVRDLLLLFVVVLGAEWCEVFGNKVVLFEDADHAPSGFGAD